MARKGRARRFREARELKQGFDDGLFSEGERSLADVTDDDESDWDDDDVEDDDDWDEDDPLLIDEGGRSGVLNASGVSGGPDGRDRCRSAGSRRPRLRAFDRALVSRARRAPRPRCAARRPRSAAQRGARVGEAVAVGAERHERLRHEPARSGRAPTFM